LGKIRQVVKFGLKFGWSLLKGEAKIPTLKCVERVMRVQGKNDFNNFLGKGDDSGKYLFANAFIYITRLE
jgi:hypothetical protein